MFRILVALSIAPLLAAAAPNPTLSEPVHSGLLDGDSAWIVRVYDAASLNERVLTEAKQVAAGLLSDAGASVAWVNCTATSGRCSGGLRENELVLRLVPEAANKGALGYALVPPGNRLGRYATIYAEGVADLARGFKTRDADLLGYTIAHELGHLLLGRNSHSKRGIMRADWNVWDARRMESRELTFTAEQRDRLEQAGRMRVGASLLGDFNGVDGGVVLDANE